MSESLAELLAERHHLLGIGVSMFGSAATAEWVVQETYRRWYALTDDERAGIPVPRAWLTRVAEGVCLDLLAADRALVGAPQPAHEAEPLCADPVLDEVARRFATACDTGDVAALAAVLSADAEAVCDGGGKVRAPACPIRGATEVARFVTALLAGRAGTVLAVEPVNGCAGLALRRAGRAVAVISVSVAGAEVTNVWIVLNPDKLHGWHR